jgi:cellulose synthase/poly-beta-1,6-N-acetylglucosamine synthase-like glycosyltransferase
VSFFVLAFVCGVYVLLMLAFGLGAWLARLRKTESGAMPSVSVVVPLHNEAANLERTLHALDAQDYRGIWEVVLVDDRSTDASPHMIDAFCASHPRFCAVHVPQNLPAIPSPKKRALEAGIQRAQGAVILSLDADCVPQPGWLGSMAACFVDGVGIVQGPKANNGPGGLLYGYQKLETLGFTTMEAGGFGLGRPMLASAANLAYRKELFWQAGGFGDLMQYASGDDDMLVQKMAALPGVRARYNGAPQAVVETAPVDSWRALLNQRARWASNGTSYSSVAYVLLLSFVYSFYAWLVLCPFLIPFGMPASYLWAPFLAKVCVDLFLLGTGGALLGQKKLLLYLGATEIIQVPLIAIAVPLGLTGAFKWKTV